MKASRAGVVKILYPLPREGALAGSMEVCETLGGTHTADLDVCTGYSASSDHAPYVSDALKDPFAPSTPSDDLSSRGACSWTANPLFASGVLFVRVGVCAGAGVQLGEQGGEGQRFLRGR